MRFALKATTFLLIAGSSPYLYAQATIRVPATAATIQRAIDTAEDGDTVVVAPGRYPEAINFKGKAITVQSSGGPSKTIIDGGGIVGRATVTFTSGETRASVLSGFTIQNGGASLLSPANSGGIFIDSSAPTISGNIVTANICNGIVSYTAAPRITHNAIQMTRGGTGQSCILSQGAAVLIFGTPATLSADLVPTIDDNLISDNQNGSFGETGGIQLWLADRTLIRGNTIRNNSGIISGAIIGQNTTQVSILQNLIYANSGGSSGAIWLLPPGASVGSYVGLLASNTIVLNKVATTSTFGGAAPASQVFVGGNLAQYLFVNNIVVGQDPLTAAITCDPTSSSAALTPPVFDHNDVFPGAGIGYSGSCSDQNGMYGNISSDPLFTNPTSGDFTLSTGSPAIDSGNNSAPLLTTFDIQGSKRILDASGRGFPIVDLGAYERVGVQEASVTTLTLNPSQYFRALYSDFSNALTFSATLAASSGTPTGSVDIYVDDVKQYTTIVGSSGLSTFSIPGLPPGLHSFVAQYAGATPFSPASSVKFYLLIPALSANLTLSSSANPTLEATPVTFTVGALQADGTVLSPLTLTDNSTNTALATLTPKTSGTASFTTSALTPGDHDIYAVFAGDNSYRPTDVSLTQHVVASVANTTSLVCSPNTVALGQTATLTATVSASGTSPSGTVLFFDDTASLGQVALTGGSASVRYNARASGSHTLTATYQPTNSGTGSTATCIETVELNPTTSILTIPGYASPVTYGSPLVLTATVQSAVRSGFGLPTGIVGFADGAQGLGTATLVNGATSLTVSNLRSGADMLSCSYLGDANYAPSDCSPLGALIVPAVSSLTLASGANPDPASESPVFTVHLTLGGQAAPAGVPLALEVGTGMPVPLSTNSMGDASYTSPPLAPGIYPIKASFAGSMNYASSQAQLSQVIQAVRTTTTLSVAPNPSVFGNPVTLTAQVSSNGTISPSGNVTFLDGSAVIGTTSLNGSAQAAVAVATLQTSSLTVGMHFLTASFGSTGLLEGSVSPPV